MLAGVMILKIHTGRSQVPNLNNARVSTVNRDISAREFFYRKKLKKIRHFEIFQTRDKPEISQSTVETHALTRFGIWRD